MPERTYPYRMHLTPDLNAELERIAEQRGFEDGVAGVLREGLKLVILEDRLKKSGGSIIIERADGTRREVITPGMITPE